MFCFHLKLSINFIACYRLMPMSTINYYADGLVVINICICGWQ